MDDLDVSVLSPFLGRSGHGSEGKLTRGNGTNPSVYLGEGNLRISPVLSLTP